MNADLDDLFGPDEAAPGAVAGELPAPPVADANAQVEAALFRRAVGGVTWSEKLDRFGETVRLEADLPPDITAARIWLERQNPERWADKRQPDVRVIVARLGPGSERAAVLIESQRVIEGEISDP